MSGSWILIVAAAAGLCGLLARRRIQRIVRGQENLVTDAVLRKVLDEGEVEVPDPDEPLDEYQIKKAEDEFWSTEDWDESEPWDG